MTGGIPSPTRWQPTPPGRVVGVDLARLLALLGMFAAHLLDPLDPGAPGGVDPLFQLVAGRSSALFALLAGVGLVLASRDAAADPLRHRLRVAVRAALVALVGLLLGGLSSGLAVILAFYGVLFLCALPVLTWRARSLALLAAGWGLAAPVASLLLRRSTTSPARLVPSLADLAHPGQLGLELVLTGYYPVLTWATYLFAGMAVGRLDLLRPLVAPRLALAGAWLAGLALGVSSLVTSRPQARAALLADTGLTGQGWAALDTELRRGLHGTHPPGSAWWLGVWSPHSGSIVDLAHTTGSALLVLGLALWLVRLLPDLPWRVLTGAGAMALTLYTTHVAVLASPLGARGGTALTVHAGLALALGAAFAAVPARGPLEAAVSAATRLVRVRTPGPRHPR